MCTWLFGGHYYPLGSKTKTHLLVRQFASQNLLLQLSKRATLTHRRRCQGQFHGSAAFLFPSHENFYNLSNIAVHDLFSVTLGGVSWSRVGRQHHPTTRRSKKRRPQGEGEHTTTPKGRGRGTAALPTKEEGELQHHLPKRSICFTREKCHLLVACGLFVDGSKGSNGGRCLVIPWPSLQRTGRGHRLNPPEHRRKQTTVRHRFASRATSFLHTQQKTKQSNHKQQKNKEQITDNTQQQTTNKHQPTNHKENTTKNKFRTARN